METLQRENDLFQPNDLSRLKPELIKVSDARLCQEIGLVLRTAYDVLDLSAIEVCRVAGANIVSQNLLVRLGDRMNFLKCRRGIGAQPRLAEEATLATRVLERGVRAPRVIRSNSGAFVTVLNETCWVLFDFQDGSYFRGEGRELDSAAEQFGKLTKAAQELAQGSSCQPAASELVFLEELEGLLAEIAAARHLDPAVTNLCTRHRHVILKHLQDVRAHRSVVEAEAMLLHLDYHPMNLLMDYGEVACILDFEDVKVYPVLAALGWGAYKLIRQMMVLPEIRAQEFRSPSLVNRWLSGWHMSFPEARVSHTALGLGARYRLLAIIHGILEAYVRRGDERSNYDLAKQLGSFDEIDVIFGERCRFD